MRVKDCKQEKGLEEGQAGAEDCTQVGFLQMVKDCMEGHFQNQ